MAGLPLEGALTTTDLTVWQANYTFRLMEADDTWRFFMRMLLRRGVKWPDNSAVRLSG